MNYQVIKLSNGEDIVCKVHENSSSRENSKLKISSPLKMETITRDTSKGVVESLALSRWVQPYSDEEIFKVIKTLIKQRKEAAEIYSNAGRLELAEKEKFEISYWRIRSITRQDI